MTIDKVVIKIGEQNIEFDAEAAYQLLKAALGKHDIIINPSVPYYPSYPIYPWPYCRPEITC